MQHPETVTTADGFVVNKEDYDANPDKFGALMDELTTAKGKGATPTREDAAAKPEAPPMLAGNPLNPAGQPEGILTTPTVVQKGDKYFVVDDKGEHDARFNPKGYKTDVDAWTEVGKLQPQTVTV